MGLEASHDIHALYPTATLPHATLPPEKRLSWLPDMLHNFGIGGGEGAWLPSLDRDKGWDDPANFPIKERNIKREVRAMSGYYDFLCCPLDPSLPVAMQSHLTNYVGLTGLGEEAARLPLADPRVGFFGYDRKIRRRDITDGLSTSATISETGQNNGCWFKGGSPTARGLVADGSPYLGVGGQFGSRHRYSTSVFTLQPTNVSHFAFADGSVRVITEGISSPILEALFTIRGGEEVSLIGEE